jgi:peptidoglycan/xylan/chitin deacetylase (PgdA/CDA1 family)
VDHPTFVYLTFDDGPNEGTDAVLNALAAERVPATFFINSHNLYDPKREMAERNARR